MKLIQKIKKSYWFVSGSYSLLNRLSITMFGILTFLMLVRLIDPEELGVWSLFLSVTGVLESIRNAFIYSPLLKYYGAADEAEKPNVAFSSLKLNLGSGIAQVLILILVSLVYFMFWDAPGLDILYYIFCGSALFYTPLSHVIFIQQAKQNFAGTFYASLVQKLIPFAYISYVFLVDEDLSLVSLALYQLLGYVVAIAVALPFSDKKDLKFGSSESYVSDLFNFGKFTLGTNICSMVNKNIGEWIIGGVLGVGAVAIYNPAMRISSLVEIPLSTTAQIMYPELIKRLKTKGVEGISLLYQKSIGVVVLCILPMVVLSGLYAEEIVVFVAGEQYRESAGLLKIAMLGGLFLPFVRQFGVLLNAMGKMNWNFYFMLSVTVVSGVLSYFMISLMGLDGAVYSYLIISFFAAIVTLVVLKFLLGIDFVKSFRSVL